MERHTRAQVLRSPVLIAVALLAGCGAALWGQPAVDMNLLGPAIGSAAPTFSGRDQHGQRQTLDTVMGDDGLMLVFFRSADW